MPWSIAPEVLKNFSTIRDISGRYSSGGQKEKKNNLYLEVTMIRAVLPPGFEAAFGAKSRQDATN